MLLALIFQYPPFLLSDAIRAVDEACDESQRTRVRNETARIVSISFNLLDLLQRLSRVLI